MDRFKLFCLLLMITSIILISQCATLAPPDIKLESTLTPTVNESEPKYALEEDGAIACNLEGLKIVVKPMTDEKLDKMFPDISYKEEASTNPYTYGNWVDPDLGYTPNRFTVFVVKVFNYAQPKVNLNPLNAILISQRGDQLLPYAREKKDNPTSERNFESYYEKIKGSSGVETIRFEERLGMIRKTLFTDGAIFKGDKKDGFLVFDPLVEGINEVTLTLKDFVLKYDANNWPQEKIDIQFMFKRELKKTVEPKADEK